MRTSNRPPGERLEAYALMAHGRPNELGGTEIAALVHRGEHVAQAQPHLHGFVRDLIADAAQSGQARSDVAADELATYCLHALAAASPMPSKAAIRRLVDVTVAGLSRRSP
jgi:hypothetical protein